MKYGFLKMLASMIVAGTLPDFSNIATAQSTSASTCCLATLTSLLLVAAPDDVLNMPGSSAYNIGFFKWSLVSYLLIL